MFDYIWSMPPIDDFGGLVVADESSTIAVISSMPEIERTRDVYVMRVPYDNFIVPAYLCKADNNGTIYLFSDYDVFNYLSNNIKEDK